MSKVPAIGEIYKTGLTWDQQTQYGAHVLTSDKAVLVAIADGFRNKFVAKIWICQQAYLYKLSIESIDEV